MANLNMEGLKAWWGKLSKRDQWLVGCGAILAAFVLLGEAATGGPDAYTGPQQHLGYADPNGGYGQNPYAQQGPYAQQNPYAQQQMEQQQGYAQPAYGYAQQPTYGGAQAYGGGGDSDPDPTGYWARQRSQDQQSLAQQQYMLDQNTVRDNETGTVYSGVDNNVGDAAIASGAYSQVPTAELPTSTPEAAPSE
ncbi:MAG: hypothetical protein ABUS57_04345 [Pseudomonadota bacterium]